MEDIKKFYFYETTKLKRSETIKILIDIVIAILSISVGILNKNIAWSMYGSMWILVSLIEYCYYKTNKENEALIDLQSKNIKLQEAIINILLKETAVEIEINKIKIPKDFTKPKPKKMQQKYNYYRKNHKYESPIIIDMDFNLIDGYTSYLIAKECHRETVIVKLQRKVRDNNEKQNN